MNALAYFIVTAGHGPVLYLVNFIIYLIVALIVWLMLKYVAAEFGVPAQIINLIGLLIFLLIFLSLFVGCATDTGDPAKDKRARITNAVLEETFNAVLQVGLAEGRNALAGQNGQDAASAAFEAAGTINGAAALAHILTAAAGPQIAPVAQVAMQQITAANPQTPADRVKLLNTVGAAIQTAANQSF